MAVAPTPPAPNADAITQTAQQLYGYLASYLNDPEVGGIIRNAAINKWDSATLQGALFRTDWWQRTSQSARLFDNLQRTDPATASANVSQTLAQIQALAGSLGVQADPSRLQALATEATRLSWNTDQIRQGLAQEFHYDPTKAASGAAATSLTQLKQLSKDYAVNIGDAALGGWMQQMVAGTQNVDGFKQYLIGQAKSRYPTIAGALDGGTTTTQFFDPYKQEFAQALSIAPDSIDLNDPKWNRFLMQTDEQGNRVVAPLDQALQTVKADKQYGYAGSKNGINDAYAMLAEMGKDFGRAV